MTPNNNDLESFWKTCKGTMLVEQRVGHRALLEKVFAQMLYLMDPDWIGPATRCSAHVASASYKKAVGLWDGDC